MLDLILLNVAAVYFIDVIDEFFLEIERMILVRNIAIVCVSVDRVVIPTRIARIFTADLNLATVGSMNETI